MRILPKLPRRCRAGFTLIEAQVTVAVIALLAAILVPQIPRLTAQASLARGRANGKNLAAAANAASAAGARFTSLDMAIEEVVRPGGVSGNFGLKCEMSTLSPAEVTEAKGFLDFWEGQVLFDAK